MVIVGGSFEVDPSKREEYLATHHDLMRRSRAEPGCLEYTFSADPLDPSRVLLFERWATQGDLDAHLAASRAAPDSAAGSIVPKASSLVLYDVAGERPLG